MDHLVTLLFLLVIYKIGLISRLSSKNATNLKAICNLLNKLLSKEKIHLKGK